MKHQYSLFLALLLLIFNSCKDDELASTIPAYIKIDDISVKINDPVEGSASDMISDAWVYVNDQLIGAYELPTVVPILRTGPVKVTVRGGIFNNGLSNQRVVYPFYEFFTFDTILTPEVIYEPKVEVEYKPLSVFNPDWPGEDFETGVNFENNPNSDTNLVRTTDANKVFEGNASGAISLPVGTTFAEFHTTNIADIPRLGTAVYLEMNYKTTHDFAVSIYATDNTGFKSQFSVVNFRANNEWNKVYVDFSKVFSSLFDATYYNIAFGLVKPVNEEAELLVDNVKLINF